MVKTLLRFSGIGLYFCAFSGFGWSLIAFAFRQSRMEVRLGATP
jgi:outer membrane phospholipase A